MLNAILYFLGDVDWRRSEDGNGQKYMDIMILLTDIVLRITFQEDDADHGIIIGKNDYKNCPPFLNFLTNFVL